MAQPTQDELIQAELDGTIEELEAKMNDDSGEAEETPVETAEQPAEEVKAEPEQPKVEPKVEKRDSVAKLLAQRNEARAKVEELEARLKDSADSESRLKELEELIAAQELEKEEQKEKSDFYSANPQAVGHEEGIEKLRQDKNLSYSEAFQLYAAQNDPTLLLDEQYRNKSQSGATLTGVAKVETKVKEPKSVADFANMDDDDFMAWSDAQARNERAAAGYVK